MPFDLAVIGAGPAGTSAAITAARLGMRVVLCERQSMRDSAARDKVCGEFVSAEALPLLRRLAPEALAGAPRIAAAALIPRRGRRADFTLPAPGRGISRLRLDAALWRAAAAAGVECRAAAAIPPERAVATVPAGAHILACGRTEAGDWMGIKARFAGLEPSSAVELYAMPAGYCGVAAVEGGLTNVCCLVRRRHTGPLAEARGLAEWLGAHAASEPLRRRLQGGRQASPTVFTVCALGRRPAMRAGALAAGDAAGLLDPFTGDGIARALLSGELAAQAVAQGRPQAYQQELARNAGRGFRTAALLRAALLAPAWLHGPALTVLARPPLARRLVAATRWGGLQ